MFDKPQATHVLGLEFDGSSLKGAALSFARGKPRLESSFDFPVEIPTSPNENVKPLYTPEQKEQLEQLLNKNLIVTALNAQEVLIRPLDMKVKKEKDINAVLAFQAEPILPYPADNAMLDKIILSQETSGSKITLVAVRKDQLAQRLQQWNSLEIEPEVVSASPLALALFANAFTDNQDLCYVLHLGWTQSLCIVMEKGKLLAAQAIPYGVNEIVDGLAEEQGIDKTAAHRDIQNTLSQISQDSPAYKTGFTALRMAVTRTIYALAKQFKGQEINHLLVTGPGASIPQLAETLAGALNKALLVLREDPTFGMSLPELKSFALPIGEALSALPSSKEQINFRQNEFTFPAPWKRLKQPTILYMGLCLGLAIALAIFGQAYTRYLEGDIKRQYLELLSVMNRPYSEFEKEYATKTHRELPSGESPNIASLTPDEIKERLQYLEKEIQAIPQLYPLQPNVPLVSDVLAWISTHPSFVPKLKEGTDTSPSLSIESFNYTLVKRPEPTKKQEKYQVKIELEFSSPTPKMAREFHDSLIAPNDFVDSKAEIKWNSNRDRYRTSFYLKDKTVYPPT